MNGKFSFSAMVLPELLPADMQQCWRCSAEYSMVDTHLLYSDGCALCRPSRSELQAEYEANWLPAELEGASK